MQVNKKLILGIILVIVAISLFYIKEKKVSYIDNNRVNIYNITSSGSKMEQVDAYLEATYIAGVVAINKNSQQCAYYAVFNNGVQHIVYMKNDDAKKINAFLLDHPDKSYRINGSTKMISKEMEEYGKQFVKEWLDNNHGHSEEVHDHTHEITTEDFYQYFGYIYLDATINSNSYYQWLTIISVVIFLCGFTLLGYLLYEKIIKRKYENK